MKQIGVAMQNYASTYSNAFPSAEGGKPPISWRVRLLPFLDYDALYKKYHFKEPWDSPYNLEWAKDMPKVYQTPGRPDDGKTCSMVFLGKGTALDGRSIYNDPRNLNGIRYDPGANIPMAWINDGTSHTILVVEAGPEKAVPWSKPEDLPFDPVNPLAALGQIPADGFLAAMCSGDVYRFKS